MCQFLYQIFGVFLVLKFETFVAQKTLSLPRVKALYCDFSYVLLKAWD